ncbi:hypothetical protein CEXT_273371 [Caerostris extrusa]|uniref:Uncharacterized protein n=1 Tax=Caerostris extrusa TaxID=172846 RepID=A0AAV4S0Q5_CAEEX|nr:hypothetical protein CEXT_273371 [Caerostris extrusa]
MIKASESFLPKNHLHEKCQNLQVKQACAGSHKVLPWPEPQYHDDFRTQDFLLIKKRTLPHSIKNNVCMTPLILIVKSCLMKLRINGSWERGDEVTTGLNQPSLHRDTRIMTFHILANVLGNIMTCLFLTHEMHKFIFEILAILGMDCYSTVITFADWCGSSPQKSKVACDEILRGAAAALTLPIPWWRWTWQGAVNMGSNMLPLGSLPLPNLNNIT